jgi:hypothetical protein
MRPRYLMNFLNKIFLNKIFLNKIFFEQDILMNFFASAFLSPGVNSRAELEPSHGAWRRRLGENVMHLA